MMTTREKITTTIFPAAATTPPTITETSPGIENAMSVCVRVC